MEAKSKSQKQMLQQCVIPEPVFFMQISFFDEQNNQVAYTDCWQISVLRFLHLIFGEDQKINFNKLTKFMNLQNQNCKKLIDYFKQNPSYYNNCEYYKTKEGLQLRSKWCQFLNNSKLLNLKKDNEKYEVAATLANLILFYKGYFPKLKFDQKEIKPFTFQSVMDKSLFTSYQKVLNQIYHQLLNFNQEKDLKIDMKMKSISLFEDSEQEAFIYFQSVQQLFINGFQKSPLQWLIYEYYNVDRQKKTIQKRLTGHSDYRFSKNYKQKQQLSDKQ